MAALMIGVGVGTYVLGAPRSAMSFDMLYQVSIAEPVVVLVLGLAWIWGAARHPRTAKNRATER